MTIQERSAHFEKYDERANKIGLEYLLRIVENVLGDVYKGKQEQWEADKENNPHLNHIALKRWDSQHAFVVPAAVRVKAGWGKSKTAWALADTVCTLKHVAKHYWNPRD